MIQVLIKTHDLSLLFNQYYCSLLCSFCNSLKNKRDVPDIASGAVKFPFVIAIPPLGWVFAGENQLAIPVEYLQLVITDRRDIAQGPKSIIACITIFYEKSYGLSWDRKIFHDEKSLDIGYRF